jgi:redox-sensitive bicupin YhaK (pirin superfamily)
VFQHLAELPVVDVGEATATVLLGELGGAASVGRADWPMVGVDAIVRGVAELPLDPAFEHGVLVMSGAPTVDGSPVPVGTTAYLAPGRASVTLTGPARVVVVGGAPFESAIAMSWNFVARTADEIEQAYADWADAGPRFGEVRSDLARVPAPAARR